MDTNDILKATKATQRLIQDTDYYKYIFKKTERIVSVVFYITYNLPDDTQHHPDIEDIEQTARHAHNAILKTLDARTHTADEVVRGAAHALVMLESKLRVAQVAGLIAPPVLQVLVNEIDAVLRGMNKYLDGDLMLGTLLESPPPAPVSRPRQSAAQPGVGASASAAPAASKASRRDRIQTVLEARGEATIKDIAAIVSDVSEKTIQRELNAMIEDNVVKRQGERRWSRYSLF